MPFSFSIGIKHIQKGDAFAFFETASLILMKDCADRLSIGIELLPLFAGELVSFQIKNSLMVRDNFADGYPTFASKPV